jgi:hypothetical protein
VIRLTVIGMRVGYIRIMRVVQLAAAIVMLCGIAGAQPKVLKEFACPYQPGKSFAADIKITVSDRDVRVDSAMFRLRAQIPAATRSVAATKEQPARSIALLDPVPVRLDRDVVKRFSLAPSVVIEDPKSPNCRLRLEAGISNRTWAPDVQTNFKIDYEVNVEGRRENSSTELVASCMDEDTPIRLTSGDLVPVKQLIRGDTIRNPVTGVTMKIEEMIRGTQAGETLYRIGFEAHAAWFTARHPVYTKRGLQPASSVGAEDELLGEDGAYHPVTIVETRVGDPNRAVYNMRFKGSSDSRQHMLSANGIVAGDFFLQESMQPKQTSSR